MIMFPNAKVNLGLYITQKRNDGFHNIETLFLPVPKLCDILEILPQTNQSKAVVFTQTGIEVDADIDDNLCVKAYALLSKYADLPKVAMHLHKQIPLGAGLGGGSANGAFALKMLNEMASQGVDQNTLADIALELGSDCPFFLTNYPSFASGRGERLQEVNINLKGFYILLANPGIHVNTGKAYGLSTPKPALFNLRHIGQLPMEQWKESVYNDFEKVVFPLHPEIADLKEKFYQMGATYASMSGSGSTVFGFFSKRPDIDIIPKQFFTHLSEL